MNLFQAATLGGVDKSADGIAAKIRREAEQAFQERMTKDAQAFQTSERIAGQKFQDEQAQAQMAHDANQTAAQIGAREQEGLLSRAHATKEREAGQSWQTDEKKKDRLHDLKMADKELERAVKTAEAKAKGKGVGSDAMKERRLAYETLIDNKYKLLDTLTEFAADDEAIKAVSLEISHLEKALKSDFALGDGEGKPTLTKEQVINAAMSKYPGESRDTIIEKLKQDKKYGHLFQEESPVPTASNESGLINSVRQTSIVG